MYRTVVFSVNTVYLTFHNCQHEWVAIYRIRQLAKKSIVRSFNSSLAGNSCVGAYAPAASLLTDTFAAAFHVLSNDINHFPSNTVCAWFLPSYIHWRGLPAVANENYAKHALVETRRQLYQYQRCWPLAFMKTAIVPDVRGARLISCGKCLETVRVFCFALWWPFLEAPCVHWNTCHCSWLFCTCNREAKDFK